ncbi:MAG: ABC transporter substrate-binding protein [Dehalococcoidia bacterium]|nr:ABC transporter substrate-binding protein [Dehalococcoidia bacterium]
MKNNWKRGIACLLVLALVTVLGLSCGDEEEGEKVTIVIGQVTDLTGAASVAVIPLHYVLTDIIDYYNEKGLIPGVKLKLVTYDTHYDPARVIPGYEWCRERGAEVIVVWIATDAEPLRPFGERDKVVIATSSTTPYLMEPPGWAFGFGASYGGQTKTLLKWISEEDWDYSQGIPELGFVGWRVPAAVDQEKAISEYCQAHSEKFDYVGGRLPPPGTMRFTAEVEQLKDCDYIVIYTTSIPYFIRDFQVREFEATFLADSSAGSFQGWVVDMVGWEDVDGFLSLEICRMWGEPYPNVELAEELLYKYHPAKADEIVYAGSSYVGAFSNMLPLFQILEKAIEEVGADNFDGQAFYNAAENFEVQYEGYPKWFFTETRRYLMGHGAIYEWSAEAEDRARVSDWLPLIEE